MNWYKIFQIVILTTALYIFGECLNKEMAIIFVLVSIFVYMPKNNNR